MRTHPHVFAEVNSKWQQSLSCFSTQNIQDMKSAFLFQFTTGFKPSPSISVLTGISCWNTDSHMIAKVRQFWTRSVHIWVATWKYHVLWAWVCGDKMDNIPELWIGDPSSNSSSVLYIHLYILEIFSISESAIDFFCLLHAIAVFIFSHKLNW